MKSTRQFLLGGMLALAAAAVAPSTHAQKIYGQEGSADATMSIDGKQIPAPPLKFGGVLKEDVKDSKVWWPPRLVPPKGVPTCYSS